jgi:hypothetical protein
VTWFHGLVGGHPFLVRRGLHEMVSRGISIASFGERAGSADWIYGDHLRRLLTLLRRDAKLCEAMRELLRGGSCRTLDSFYRLRSAGAIVGDSERDARPRCPLYAVYLRRHLL